MSPFSRRSDFEAEPGAFERARREATPELDLTRSSPLHVGLELPEPPPLKWGSYAPHPFGAPVAREAIARSVDADPERLVLTASTSEAYAHLFKLLCDPGDTVLVPRPSYPLFEMLGRLEGVHIETYPLRWAGEWMLDRAALSAGMHDKAKAIVIVQPNNPTGSFLSHEDLAHLASFGRPIISDEVFGEYAFAERPPPVDSGELRFVLDGLSKSAGLPHAKLAWIRVEGAEAPEALARLEHITDAFLSPSGPVMDHAAVLLEVGRRRREIIRSRLVETLEVLGGLAGAPFDVLPVEAGWYAMLRLPSTRTDESWALALLERGVLVQPGYFYDVEAEAHLVVSLLTPPAEMRRGLEVIREVVGEG